MLVINELKSSMPMQDVLCELQAHMDSFGIFFDLDRINEIMALCSRRNRKLNRKMAEALGLVNFSFGDKEQVATLLHRLGVPKNMLLSEDDNFIVNAKVRYAIESMPNISKQALAVVEALGEYATNTHTVNALRSYSILPECKETDFRGRRMVRGTPKLSLLATNRLSTAEPNIQGIPRDFVDIITQPKGYTYLSTDSRQIEPKLNFSLYLHDDLIVYMINAYDDAYYALYHFCILPEEELMQLRQNPHNLKVLEITPELKAGRSQLKTLVNAGSYGSTALEGVSASLASAFTERIVNHPARKEHALAVTRAVKSGVSTFYTAFGNPISPEKKKKYKTEQAQENHLIRCGVNNPVQGTAADLMRESIIASLKLLRSSKSYIAMQQHDKLAFYIHDDDLNTELTKELEDIVAYQVLDWAYIGADFHYGVPEPTTPTYLLDWSI